MTIGNNISPVSTGQPIGWDASFRANLSPLDIGGSSSTIMFAKVFNQIFDSSIADDPALRHMFMDMLVLADWEGVVDMTHAAIAARTRMPLDEVNRLLTLLAQPDVNSRSTDANGARIVLLDPVNRNWGWQIVNYQKYRMMRSEDHRKEYMRKYMQKRRNPEKEPVLTDVNSVNTCKHLLAHTDTDTDKVPPIVPQGGNGVVYPEEFIRFWTAYPRKEAKGAALRAWKKPGKPEISVLLSAIDRQKQSDKWTKEGGQFIPMPATWLNNRRWEDELKRPIQPKMF